MDLYNVKDEEYKSYLKGLCLAGLPIPFYNKFVNHIKVKDIFTMGEQYYKKIMLPFMLTTEFIYGKKIPNIDMLDILTNEEFFQYRDDLCIVLGLIFDINPSSIDVVSIEEKKELLITDKNNFSNNLYINSDKFERLRTIILFMNCLRELSEIDKEGNKPKSTEEYNKRLAIFYKGKEEYDKVKSKNSSSDFVNMFDFLVHSQRNIDYKNIVELNMYQFYNSVKRYNQKEDFDFTRNLYSSGQMQLKGVEIPKFLKTIIEDNK